MGAATAEWPECTGAFQPAENGQLLSVRAARYLDREPARLRELLHSRRMVKKLWSLASVCIGLIPPMVTVGVGVVAITMGPSRGRHPDTVEKAPLSVRKIELPADLVDVPGVVLHTDARQDTSMVERPLVVPASPMAPMVPESPGVLSVR